MIISKCSELVLEYACELDSRSNIINIFLLKYIPYEFTAVRTESWLPQECSHKFVTICLMNLTSHGTSSMPNETLPFFEFSSGFFSRCDASTTSASDSFSITCTTACLLI